MTEGCLQIIIEDRGVPKPEFWKEKKLEFWNEKNKKG